MKKLKKTYLNTKMLVFFKEHTVLSIAIGCVIFTALGVVTKILYMLKKGEK